jgi:anti-sigma factor RsiW
VSLLSFWRRRRELVCREAVELMTEYLDDVLPQRDRVRLESHLAGCPHCSEHLAQLRITIDTMGRARPEDLDDDALDDLVGLYRRWRSE